MTAIYSRASSCRIGGGKLVPLLSLGEQALTGVFPRSAREAMLTGPLDLMWCPTSGLVQLGHSFDTATMFGENYGYRSGLNAGMVSHLGATVARLEARISLAAGDVVVDIGSNDGTTLGAYKTPGLRRIGIDPTGAKFADYYPAGVELIPDYFSVDAFRAAVPDGQARIVTSLSMFYDLQDPIGFARQVESILAPDGIWLLEQSYLPAMLRATSYDTICHEHLEYYRLSTIQAIAEAAQLKVIEVSFNDVNGGSFAVVVAKKNYEVAERDLAVISWVLDQEERAGLGTLAPYRDFANRVAQHRVDLRDLIDRLNSAGCTVLGYGASTKGNVMLQYCGFTAEDIPAIAEVNADKFGRYTPGSGIPIVSEAEAHRMKPDYFLVLPWHFRRGILEREQQFRANGGKFIFPLPHIEIV